MLKQDLSLGYLKKKLFPHVHILEICNIWLFTLGITNLPQISIRSGEILIILGGEKKHHLK